MARRTLVRVRAGVISAVLLVTAGFAAEATGPAFSKGVVAHQVPVSRDCRSTVYGGLGDTWLARSVVVGPIVFVGADAGASPEHSFASVGGGRYRGSKLLVVVRTGWAVRVLVPDAEALKVALQYAPADFNKSVVPDQGERDVTFTACPPGRQSVGPTSAKWTQFNGGVVVAGARCVTLDVYAAKQGHPLPTQPVSAHLPFGTTCPGATSK